MMLEEAVKYAASCHSALHRYMKQRQIEERCPICGATLQEVRQEAGSGKAVVSAT